MFFKIRTKLGKKTFDFAVRAVLKTPKMPCDPDAKFIVLTQIYEPDLFMYIMAAKSFGRFLRPKKFVIVDDGLTVAQRQTIEQHFEHVEFIRSQSARVPACPVGGCWERLLSIASMNNDDYVVQLDADTLTIAEPKEVSECISQGRCFTLGTRSGREIVSLDQASNFALAHESDHVQVRGEIAFKEFPNNNQLKYVRGCAGFAGYAKRTITQSEICDFSTTMTSLVGKKKWQEWGSEQLTSNFLVANSENPLVLPVDKYPFMAPEIDPARCRLVHFYGPNRFVKGAYPRVSKRIIAELHSA